MTSVYCEICYSTLEDLKASKNADLEANEPKSE